MTEPVDISLSHVTQLPPTDPGASLCDAVFYGRMLGQDARRLADGLSPRLSALVGQPDVHAMVHRVHRTLHDFSLAMGQTLASMSSNVRAAIEGK